MNKSIELTPFTPKCLVNRIQSVLKIYLYVDMETTGNNEGRLSGLEFYRKLNSSPKCFINTNTV